MLRVVHEAVDWTAPYWR